MAIDRMRLLLLAGALCVLVATLGCGCTGGVQPLIDDLYADDPATQRAAAEELVGIGTPAVEPLIGVFASGDQSASMWAAAALCQIGDASIDPLIDELQAQDENERIWAINTLACIGQPAILPLINEVETGTAISMESARVALIKMGPAAVPALQQRMAMVDEEKKDTYRKLILSIQITEQMRTENVSGAANGNESG